MKGSTSFFFPLPFLPKKIHKPKGDLEKWNNEVFSDVGVEKNKQFLRY